MLWNFLIILFISACLLNTILFGVYTYYKINDSKKEEDTSNSGGGNTLIIFLMAIIYIIFWVSIIIIINKQPNIGMPNAEKQAQPDREMSVMGDKGKVLNNVESDTSQSVASATPQSENIPGNIPSHDILTNIHAGLGGNKTSYAIFYLSLAIIISYGIYLTFSITYTAGRIFPLICHWAVLLYLIFIFIYNVFIKHNFYIKLYIGGEKSNAISNPNIKEPSQQSSPEYTGGGGKLANRISKTGTRSIFS